jgi:hypothetical protein
MKITLIPNPDDGLSLLPEDLDSQRLVQHLLGPISSIKKTRGGGYAVVVRAYDEVAISELPLLKFLAAAHNWAVQIPKELQ